MKKITALLATAGVAALLTACGDDSSAGETTKVTLGISGSDTITVAGTTDTQRVDISGSGGFRAGELASKAAKVDISGAATP